MRPEIIHRKKKIKGSSSTILHEFIDEFQNSFCRRAKQYIKYKIDDEEIEHIFYYGEQQTKSFITATLDQLCDSYFMQEFSIERKNIRGKKASDPKSGRVDYYFRYGENTKFSALLEVKQGWIRYYNKEKWTMYAYVFERHQSAVEQLKKIKDKLYFKIDNLYGLALTILPLFVRYSKGEKQMSLNSDTLCKIAGDALYRSGAYACGYWVIPRKLCPIDNWEKIYENHPGIVFLWSISKYTRK